MERSKRIVIIIIVLFGLYSILYSFGQTEFSVGGQSLLTSLSYVINGPHFKLYSYASELQATVNSSSFVHTNKFVRLINAYNSSLAGISKQPTQSKIVYAIAFYPQRHWYIHPRTKGMWSIFKNCKYTNCKLIKKPNNFTAMDAVIMKGRRLPEKHPFSRPLGQVWIFQEEEVPLSFNKQTDNWRSSIWNWEFNYTMTYDRQHSDIFLPYGSVIRQNDTVPKRDYLAIARSKTKDAIIFTSHCLTRSKRLEYIKELSKYIGVDVFGICGKPYPCGRNHKYNRSCFGTLNSTYRFYLAFENTLCRGYRTEKFYDNYNEDIVIVARGDQGEFNDLDKYFKNTYISTSDFKDVIALGKYLKHLSENPTIYADYLQRKAKYYSTFKVPYKKAMCTLCERLNEQAKYRKQIANLETWAMSEDVCYRPKDLPDEYTNQEDGIW